MKNLTDIRIVLASQSPRRKMLLEQMGLDLEILPADVDETREEGQGPEAYVRALSLKKAAPIMEMRPNAWVIGADTIVVVDEDILVKPGDREEAMEMFRALSGRFHSVFTGFSVGCLEQDRVETRAVESRVRFKTLSEDEVRWYASTDEPYDKAGGYAVQGMGAFMIREIQGSWSNVVGLPVCEVVEVLEMLGVVQFKG